jgi:hypothetical protein
MLTLERFLRNQVLSEVVGDVLVHIEGITLVRMTLVVMPIVVMVIMVAKMVSFLLQLF